MVKKIIYPRNKTFFHNLKRINRKRPIDQGKITDIITYYSMKNSNVKGIKILTFWHQKSECYIKINVLEDHIKVIAVSCSKKGFKEKRKK
ncbi:MAG: hypothetical protein HeimC3_38480 [Candidatus Heimdallarchaeota archaeon LC_3]|nr:MAG: hypothetical protein HeimC3_38480 [Candidatus Heimdallarchaeota archaeon LC_3]